MSGACGGEVGWRGPDIPCCPPCSSLQHGPYSHDVPRRVPSQPWGKNPSTLHAGGVGKNWLCDLSLPLGITWPRKQDGWREKSPEAGEIWQRKPRRNRAAIEAGKLLGSSDTKLGTMYFQFNVHIYSSIRLPVYPHIPVHPTSMLRHSPIIHKSTHSSVHSSTQLLSIHLFMHPSIRPPIRLSPHPPIHPTVLIEQLLQTCSLQGDPQGTHNLEWETIM